MDTGPTALTGHRFDALRHEYVDVATGEVLPHITGMLKTTGLVDDRWFTEESRERGSAVHRLTLDYDLDALDLAQCRSPHRGYAEAWAAAMTVARPEWTHLEEMFVHTKLRFAGTPDRVGRFFTTSPSVVEGKTGGHEKAHLVQTALQAILVGHELKVPPESVARFVVYMKPDGKFKVEQHVNLKDFKDARRVILATCAL